MLAYAVLVCTALNFSMMTFALRHLNASTAMVIPPPPHLQHSRHSWPVCPRLYTGRHRGWLPTGSSPRHDTFLPFFAAADVRLGRARRNNPHLLGVWPPHSAAAAAACPPAPRVYSVSRSTGMTLSQRPVQGVGGRVHANRLRRDWRGGDRGRARARHAC